MTQLIPGTATAMLADGFEITPIGLTVRGQPTLEQFGSAVSALGRMANATQWALGDLLVYAEGRGDWGETYSQFLSDTDRSYHSIAKANQVCENFPPGDMRQYADEASFSHHYEVLRAPRSKRMELLSDAVDRDWSCAVLRDHVNSVLADERMAETRDDDDDDGSVSVTGAPTVSGDEWPDKVTVLVECQNEAAFENLEAYCNATSFAVEHERFKLSRQ